MADENGVVGVEQKPVVIDGMECRTIKEMILYKMDRTFAVLGIILLGAWAISNGAEMPAPAIQITTGAVTALATYIGGRTGK